MNIKCLPNPRLVQELYHRYYTSDTTPADIISSHWKEYGSKINVSIDTEGNIIQLDGCGFGNWRDANIVNKLLNNLCNSSYLLRLPYKKEIHFLEGRIKEKLINIGAYVSYDCFRQICSFITIKKHLDEANERDFNVLIIGDGHGFLSLLMKTIYPSSKVILLDIGKVLLFQSINLQNAFSGCKHIGVFDDIQEKQIASGDFIYCPAENIERINNLKYRVIISISGMQEMNYNSIGRYFAYIRKHSTLDNLFYCCSRVAKVLPGGEKIEFHKYPWHPKDKYLVDEEPGFYRYFLSTQFPFFQFFDGSMHHRLTNLYTGCIND